MVRLARRSQRRNGREARFQRLVRAARSACSPEVQDRCLAGPILRYSNCTRPRETARQGDPIQALHESEHRDPSQDVGRKRLIEPVAAGDRGLSLFRLEATSSASHPVRTFRRLRPRLARRRASAFDPLPTLPPGARFPPARSFAAIGSRARPMHEGYGRGYSFSTCQGRKVRTGQKGAIHYDVLTRPITCSDRSRSGSCATAGLTCFRRRSLDSHHLRLSSCPSSFVCVGAEYCRSSRTRASLFAIPAFAADDHAARTSGPHPLPTLTFVSWRRDHRGCKPPHRQRIPVELFNQLIKAVAIRRAGRFRLL